MNNKPNAMLAKRDAMIYAEYRLKLDIANQICLDAAMIAANKVLQLGKGRAVQFGQEFMTAVNDIATLMVTDAKDDKEIVFAREKLDKKIKQIVGEENFDPWMVRYSKENKFRKGKK